MEISKQSPAGQYGMFWRVTINFRISYTLMFIKMNASENPFVKLGSGGSKLIYITYAISPPPFFFPAIDL